MKTIKTMTLMLTILPTSQLMAQNLVSEYSGQPIDKETGLVYMQQRYFDRQSAAFMTPDPLALKNSHFCIQSPRECQLWTYAKSNPISYHDPKGTNAMKLLRPLIRVAAVAAAGNHGMKVHKELSKKAQTDRGKAFAATEGYEPGTLGSVMHTVIGAMTIADPYGLTLGAGGDGIESIHDLVTSRDVKKLLKKRPENEEANMALAEAEQQMWEARGSTLGAAVSPEVRAVLQRVIGTAEDILVTFSTESSDK